MSNFPDEPSYLPRRKLGWRGFHLSSIRLATIPACECDRQTDGRTEMLWLDRCSKLYTYVFIFLF